MGHRDKGNGITKDEGWHHDGGNLRNTRDETLCLSGVEVEVIVRVDGGCSGGDSCGIVLSDGRVICEFWHVSN